MKKSKKDSASSACPCGSSLAYSDCCGVFHAGQAAPDAERLMRSRYCAYVLGLEEYLLATWDKATRPASLALAESVPVKWLGLKVLRHAEDGDVAEVVFVARYKIAGRAAVMREVNHFRRKDKHWFYVDGVVFDG